MEEARVEQCVEQCGEHCGEQCADSCPEESGERLVKLDDLVQNIMDSGQENPSIVALRKMVEEGDSSYLMDELKKLGINPKDFLQALQRQGKALKTRAPKKGQTTTGIFINNKRKASEMVISLEFPETTILRILKANPVPLQCSRLAVGKLAGKTVKVWYDPTDMTLNRRVNRLVGFNAGSKIFITCDDQPLTMKEFMAAEKLLRV